MLYPRSNPFRQCIELSGFWDFCFDPDASGDQAGWSKGDFPGRPIAVPASWNDQFEEGRDYLGVAWYQYRFDVPWPWDGSRRVGLRFGSVNYLAEVWLNGMRLGQHEGGHLPFEFDVTAHLKREANVLVVRVEGELAPDRVPPGNIPPEFQRRGVLPRYPDTSFDFFPFCGIHRPVLLYATAPDAITDLTVTTEIQGREGRVHVRLDRAAKDSTVAWFMLRGHGANVSIEVPYVGETVETVLPVPDAALWTVGAPNLYELTVELTRGGVPYDRYSLPIGIRTIQINGDTLLVNGQPVYLKGFGRHEDFAVTGRGLLPAVIIKDYALMNWIGANSFRTSHYPYSEQMMDLADRLGFLVIDETPAVGLFFGDERMERRLQLCQQYTRELIARDKNHPSVIVWSLANEPRSDHPAAKAFFRTLYDLAKSLDPTRPVTVVSSKGVLEESFEFCDLLCLNRYYGWYTEVGQIEQGSAKLSVELDAMYEKFHKPLIMTEFGADTISGWHAQPPEMFSEEYQALMIGAVIDVLRSKRFVVGEHIWNMCDFKTGQSIRRVAGMNLKGVFTRDRRPKLAAHRLRERWRM
jgi:beta-glucuronidase